MHRGLRFPHLTVGLALVVTSLLLTAGCGNKSEDDTAAAPAGTSAGSKNVPAAANQAAQGSQQMGQQVGQQNASNAAAWRAAREKAEGK